MNKLLATFLICVPATGSWAQDSNDKSVVLAVHRVYGEYTVRSALGYIEEASKDTAKFISCDRKVEETIKKIEFLEKKFICEDLPGSNGDPIGVTLRYKFNLQKNTYNILDSDGNVAKNIRCDDVPEQFLWAAKAAMTKENEGIVFSSSQFKIVSAQSGYANLQKSINIVNEKHDVLASSKCSEVGNFVVEKTDSNSNEISKLKDIFYGAKMPDLLKQNGVITITNVQ